ncbi:MAG: hypothetical protein CVU79_04500 [Elusimicrobia bacterium HGW-Elusimicrobia-3]|jgi:hypothetical protein|nr:MAG: hypothetical protein CVU79_04500 [Elusimicrobia bacterium HGW-Elusimicrobia-3]
MSARRFWIRQDRANYFLSGVVIACAIGSFVSSYWHFQDRISVRQKIKIKSNLTKEAEIKKLRDTQLSPSRLRSGATRYYRMEEDTLPAMPRLGDDE